MTLERVEERDRLNILMVDDQRSKLLTYEAILGGMGDNLIRAVSAREALEILLKIQIDIVLLDVSMPEMDGFELAALIKQHPKYQQTAIIFVSAVHMTDVDQLRGYQVGAMDYVSVPIIPEILRAKVAVHAELQRKRRQLERLNEELEQRVRERTMDLALRAEELHQLNTELRRRNEELDAFCYVASHDLKAPLRGIGSYAQILLEEHGVTLGEDGHAMLSRMSSISGRLSALLDSLLHYARLSRAEMVLTQTDMQRAAEEAVDRLADDLGERGVEVRIPRPLPVVPAHEVYVGEIFANLISNAVKYNDKQSPWIEIGYTAPPEEPVVFCVRDNGIGIEPRYGEQIFDLFRRLHGQDEFGGGVGAGLTIVKQIIQRHGGKVWVESIPGDGAAFYFTLAPEHPQENGEVPEKGTAPKIDLQAASTP